MAPARTGRTPAKGAPMKSLMSSKSRKPNASILSFFKKAPPPEDPMFVPGMADPLVEQPEDAEEEKDGDIYGLDDSREVADLLRFNELPNPVKRRKLSCGDDDENRAPRLEEIASDAKSRSSPLAEHLRPRKPKYKGPFLDDSDSEDDDRSSHALEEQSTAVDAPMKEQQVAGKEQMVAPPTLRPEVTDGSPFPYPPAIAAANTDEPALLKHETSTSGDFGEFADQEGFDDDDFEGEEFQMMRYMEEQALLEAEVGEDSAMEERCPICTASLAGVTAEQATVHVNACLDGQPVPLPTAKSTEVPPQKPGARGEKGAVLDVDVSGIGKRFARAAVPRPGQANPINLAGMAGPNGRASGGSAFARLMSGHAEDEAWATAAAEEQSSRGRPAYHRTCPFYKIMPGFFICVDAFRYGAVEGCRAYFLSHFHSDHYIGLTANWTHGPIYCSKVTGSLVKSQLRTAAKYVVELEFDKTIPVPGTEGVSVTMIPANHCPGSSMFLFEKTIGNRDPTAHKNGSGPRVQRILHCGDFRACPSHIVHPQLHHETLDAVTGRTKQQKIDVCYLDTTYLNPRYSFPPQDDVIRSCAELCASLNKALVAGDESEWRKVLSRREGSGAGSNNVVSRFFKVEDKTNMKRDSSRSSGSDDNSGGPRNGNSNTKNGPLDSDPAPDNAFTSMRQMQKRQKEEEPQRSNRLLVVCGTYSIGKERICKAIAQALGTRIYAPPAKLRIVRQLDDPELAELMTSDPREAQVHMQMLMEIRAETLAEYLDSYRPHFGRVIGFRPSGWNYRPTLANGNGSAGAQAAAAAATAAAAPPGGAKSGPAAAAVGANLPPSSLPTTQLLHGAGWRTKFTARDLVPQRGSGTRHAACFGVPYSEHSSFRELALFLLALHVERVVPTVNVGSDVGRRRMKGWTDRWLGERRRGGLVRVLLDSDDDASDDRAQAGEGEEEVQKKAKEKNPPRLWDGKDGRGGVAYW